MVSVLREKFAHLDLTFSIGGQISFDVTMSYYFLVLNELLISKLSSQSWEDDSPNIVTGFPSRMGQDILLEIPWWIQRNPFFRWQNIQGNISFHRDNASKLVHYTLGVNCFYTNEYDCSTFSLPVPFYLKDEHELQICVLYRVEMTMRSLNLIELWGTQVRFIDSWIWISLHYLHTAILQVHRVFVYQLPAQMIQKSNAEKFSCERWRKVHNFIKQFYHIQSHLSCHVMYYL